MTDIDNLPYGFDPDLNDTGADFDPDYPSHLEENPVAPSPEQMSTTSKTITIDAATGITVNISMSRATEYAKEKKEVGTYLKAALPDVAVITDEEGNLIVNPEFLDAVDSIAKELLNLGEVACARQHGLEYAADDAGVIRVLNLFPGAKGGPAPVVAPGPFQAPPAAAPAAAPQVAPAAPQQAPGAIPQGQFPQAAPQPQGGGGGRPGGGNFPTSNNPNAWSNQAYETKQQIAAVIEAWCANGGVGNEVTNYLADQYPKLKVGNVPVSVGSLRGRLFGPATQAWLAAQGV